MKKSNFLLIVYLVLFLSCENSQSNKYYLIKGEVDNYNGKIYLTNAVDTKYYPDGFIKDSAIVSNGKFEFKLSKKFNIPYPFHLNTTNTISKKFILEPKNQLIIIDSLYHNTIPKIQSKNSTINHENKILMDQIAPHLATIKSEFSKLQNPDFPKDSIEKFAIAARKKMAYNTNLVLENFTNEYPNSYVGFWEIVVAQTYKGYHKELNNAYNNLSNDIKQMKAAKIFEDDMLKMSNLAVGQGFPKMKLKNKQLKELVLDVTKKFNTDYILIDFWFSHCAPCIAQFPKMKELYSSHNLSQLKIISISTDISKNINNWHKVINSYNIPWINLLDENGIKTSSMGINIFPTNYLLDGEGVILKKNISLIDLEALLKKPN